MTPREFWNVVSGRVKAESVASMAQIQAAYLGALWQRAQRMPRWETVVKGLERRDSRSGTGAPRPMTPAESRMRMRAAFAHVGFVTKGEC